LYVSIDGNNYTRLDLSKSESINQKYTLKDTTDLSTIFAPYSQSFSFPATLNNQKALGFIGHTKVLKSVNNILYSKLYVNGKLNQSGKLKITSINEEYGKIISYTGNLTSSMLSLKTRIGDDVIGDLPTNSATINWETNAVFSSLKSVKLHPTQPMDGISFKYFIPLASNSRVFQIYNQNRDFYLDNISYYSGADPTSNSVLKISELSPAIQGRSVIDMIKKKYNLNISMPIEQEAYYNDWYILCNGEQETTSTPIYLDIINPMSNYIFINGKNIEHRPDPMKYKLEVNTGTDLFHLYRNPAANSDY
ncbi:hypothetical protein, partial [Burkholderia vietnamiensis]|uniref:hypothetical protein n=1 Tax=Burkholderia vietnamiensis TaxID=60552 RepID=UPI00352E7297